MSMPKILWGVCGIGHGHTFRQIPLIDHFAARAQVLIFGYGESYDTLSARYAGNDNVQIERVAVPFYVGNQSGIDFAATAAHPNNQNVDFTGINTAALATAQISLGKPDLVISDYEPISAQYAYMQGAKLVTVDQQSKYLTGQFAKELHGTGFADEVARLRMFFPAATERLASSFFNVAQRDGAAENVTLCPPVLGDRIMGLTRTPDPAGKTILMYLSAQKPFGQSMDEIAQVCASQPDVTFHLFGKNVPDVDAPNMRIYKHGDPRFFDVLAQCNGIVSTAGHTLLSEAMHLGIPVYAIPLDLYEQQMNAAVIDYNGFGLRHDRFDAATLKLFTDALPYYAATIATDDRVLLRASSGASDITARLERHL
jgi:uncharacterized protein (TIGR00661 family)